jgi:hypothetical protein
MERAKARATRAMYDSPPPGAARCAPALRFPAAAGEAAAAEEDGTATGGGLRSREEEDPAMAEEEEKEDAAGSGCAEGAGATAAAAAANCVADASESAREKRTRRFSAGFDPKLSLAETVLGKSASKVTESLLTSRTAGSGEPSRSPCLTRRPTRVTSVADALRDGEACWRRL